MIEAKSVILNIPEEYLLLSTVRQKIQLISPKITVKLLSDTLL